MSEKNQHNTLVYRLVGRVLFRVVGQLWATRLTPVLLGLTLLYVVFERAIDLPILWRQVPTWSPLVSWSFWSTILVIWVTVIGRWMCPVFYHPQLSALWCSPIPGRVWGVLWWPPLALTLSPVVLLCLSSPWPWLAVIVSCWGAPVLILASHRSWTGVAAGVIGSGVLAGVMVLCTGPLLPVGLVLAPAFALLTGVAYLAMMGRPWSVGVRQWLGVRQHVVGALVQRDLLCIWRTQRLVLGLGAVVSVLFLLFAFAVARHGGPSQIVVWVVLCLLTPGWMQLVVQIRQRQAHQFFPHAWPISGDQRLGALAWFFGVAVVIVVCCGSLAAFLGHTPWLWWHYGTSAVVGFTLNLCAIWAALVEPRRSSAGHYLLFGCLALCFMCLAPWWVCWPINLGLSVVAWKRARAALVDLQREETCPTHY